MQRVQKRVNEKKKRNGFVALQFKVKIIAMNG